MDITMNVFDVQQIYYIARIVIAGICGIFIGLERKNRSKEAGVRTHFVVACASALMMVISKYGFGDIVSETVGGRGADGARIAAQVVSGIGFLGAGMIFVHKNTVTGLTTAAGIWATSGVGLAVGAGMYAVGVVTSALIVIAQILLHKDFRWMKNSKSKKLVIKGVTEAQYQQNLTEHLKKEGITVYDVYIEKDDGGYNYTFIIEIPDDVYEQDIISGISYKCKLSSNL